jgi:predicted methyltransferase
VRSPGASPRSRAAWSGPATSSSVAANTLHRIDEAFARRDIEAHGFTLERAWDGYRNSDDGYTKLVFDPAVCGKTDRFTHLYRRR